MPRDTDDLHELHELLPPRRISPELHRRGEFERAEEGEQHSRRAAHLRPCVGVSVRLFRLHSVIRAAHQESDERAWVRERRYEQRPQRRAHQEEDVYAEVCTSAPYERGVRVGPRAAVKQRAQLAQPEVGEVAAGGVGERSRRRGANQTDL